MINSIQILRGIAAMLVVLIHIIHDVNINTTTSIIGNFYNIENFGNIGVDLFFVISGFIMVYIHYNDFKKPQSSFVFLKKRIIRVVPLYWIFTTFSALLLISLPQLFNKDKIFSLSHYVLSMLFIPTTNSIGEVVPILGVGWTLNIEMYFYLIFSIALFFSRKYFLPLLFIILSTSIAINYTYDFTIPFFHANGKLIVYEFLFGTIIGFLYCNNIKLVKSNIFLIFSLFLISLNLFIFIDFELRLFYAGIPSAILIYSLVSLNDTLDYSSYIAKLFLLLGNASYSIYLSHVFFYKVPIKLFSTINPDLLIISSLLFTSFLGILVYKFIEKPSYKHLKNRIEELKIGKK